MQKEPEGQSALLVHFGAVTQFAVVEVRQRFPPSVVA